MAATPASPSGSSTSGPRAARPLIPPFRFSLVEEGVYRSGHPVEKNYPFLEGLRLRAIVSLTPERHAPLDLFCQEQGITVHHLPVARAVENVTLQYPDLVASLEALLQPANHPLLVHCLDGANTTGLVILGLRKLQLYNLSFALHEFSRFTRDGQLLEEEELFLDKFRQEIVIPGRIPDWLWEGKPLARHPFLLLKYPEQEQGQDTARTKTSLAMRAHLQALTDGTGASGSRAVLGAEPNAAVAADMSNTGRSRNIQALNLMGQAGY